MLAYSTALRLTVKKDHDNLCQLQITIKLKVQANLHIKFFQFIYDTIKST